jgi:hypothetical protein
MKNSFFLVIIGMLLTCKFCHAQTNAKLDSLKKVAEINRIRGNVITYFKQQNKRFSHLLKGLNKEYVVYCTPAYAFSPGKLEIFENDSTLIYHATKYELTDTLPVAIKAYVRYLLERSNQSHNWCKQRFGYDETRLQYEDEFGILFVFSPIGIPDSVSIAATRTKVFWIRRDYIEPDDPMPAEKRRFYNLFNLMDFYELYLAKGLNERFIKIVLKY